jgi:hypothetical protein
MALYLGSNDPFLNVLQKLVLVNDRRRDKDTLGGHVWKEHVREGGAMMLFKRSRRLVDLEDAELVRILLFLSDCTRCKNNVYVNIQEAMRDGGYEGGPMRTDPLSQVSREKKKRTGPVA